MSHCSNCEELCKSCSELATPNRTIPNKIGKYFSAQNFPQKLKNPRHIIDIFLLAVANSSLAELLVVFCERVSS